jgi:hypothetical protein
VKTFVPALPALALAAALSGCGGGTGESASDPVDAPPEVPAAARDAVEDLTAELGVGASAVESVEVEEVTWSDGSLGCASPGEMYTEATVEGHRITVVVDGTAYEYHDGGERDAFLCEDPTE